MAAVVALGVLTSTAPASAGTFTFVSAFGSQGSGNAQFNQPRGIAVAPSGDVYVADSLNNRVQRFRADGTFVSQWGGAGTANGQFQSPYGVAIGPSGDVFVVDRNNHRVERFTPAGVFVSKFGTVGSGNGQLSHPSAIAIDAAGTIYVADYDNRRIVKFDPAGNFQTAWGALGTADGQFQLPDGVATDAAGDVYVVDGSNRVQKFSPTGGFLLKWGAFGTGPGQFNGTGGVAVRPDGAVFVSDFNGRRVERFTTTGSFIDSFGSGGTGPGQFNRPVGIAAPFGGDVYVTDVFAARVLHFRESSLPAPVAGKTVNVRVVSGVVRVKPRGSRKFVRLTSAGRQIPVGSTVDTLRGTVELTSAAGPSGATQTGRFYKGVFVVAQKRAKKPVTDLRLAGKKFRGCPKAAPGGASKAGKVRRLWASGTGRFRTIGRFAAASARGTKWLTEDRCKGTLIRVTEGSVLVRDLVRRQNRLIRAVGFYFSPGH